MQHAGERFPQGWVGEPDQTFQNCFQLVTMLPLMFLSGQNIMGTPDLATRYGLCYSEAKDVQISLFELVLKNGNCLLRWRVVAQGILGGFLLLTIFEAVSRSPLNWS